MIIRPSIRKDKRFEAIFSDNTKINFGLKGGNTYIDHGDKIKRENYLKRHQVNENWNNPKTAGSLSAMLLWGASKSLETNLKNFKKKFNV